ncbi:hypothetical protein NC661_05910 [Aquibacillus koreensis]|uniref:Na+-translocating membrane potential-generating system MpsC domain-containing protein n=1 Tax=Aquibacillus koreensis TaxID=279446 RepID=A0A9X4AHA0_9BACI|nr:hypothetical protein [Aquibacillus koreensis]MCT2537115.1 hypothetical protein [Aquibacillus koreensis]MDC3419902.1 hypothetical protein [Aquibacillus koreensis]
MKQNNQVHQDIFKAGVLEQQVSFMENKIIILARNKRIPVLEIISEASTDTSQLIDRIVNLKYKKLLEVRLVERFNFDIEIVLRDYDPTKGMNVAIIVLKRNIEEYLAG